MVFFQCQQNRTSETHSLVLKGGGLLLNAASCSFTSKGLQMSEALQGESPYSSPGPTRFTPTILPIVTSGVKAALQRKVLVDRTGLEQLATNISSHHMNADVDTLFHIHDTSQQFESKRNGVAIGLIAASTVLILFIFYYFTQAYLWEVVKVCAVRRENTESESVQKSQCNMPLCNLMSVVLTKSCQQKLKQDSLLILCKLFESCNVFLVYVICVLMFCFTAVLIEKHWFE
jgi:hypothetical protein